MREITLDKFIENTLKTIKKETSFDIAVTYIEWYKDGAFVNATILDLSPNQYSNRLKFTLSVDDKEKE